MTRWAALVLTLVVALCASHFWGKAEGVKSCERKKMDNIVVNTQQQQGREDDIRQAPASDDGPLAPNLARTLGRLYAEQNMRVSKDTRATHTE